MDEKSKNKMELKPYTISELSRIYGVDHRTFTKWISPFADEIGKRIGWYYSIPQVKLIFQKLLLPSIIDTE